MQIVDAVKKYLRTRPILLVVLGTIVFWLFGLLLVSKGGILNHELVQLTIGSSTLAILSYFFWVVFRDGQKLHGKPISLKALIFWAFTYAIWLLLAFSYGTLDPDNFVSDALIAFVITGYQFYKYPDLFRQRPPKVGT